MKKLILITSLFALGCLSEPKTENVTTGSSNNNKPNNTIQETTPTSGNTTPKCVPDTEICDQIDNDCDGKIDEDLGDACCFSDADCDAGICDVEGKTCVQCLDNSLCSDALASKCGNEKSCVACEVADDCSHIEGNKAQCSDGACVICTSDTDCQNGQRCDIAQNVCTACLSDNDCGNEKCLVDTDEAANNICVACTANTDCSTLTAAKCGDTNECSPCVADADCSHFPGTETCADGVCVECNDDTPCGGKACDLATNTCSTQVTGSRAQCESCVSDTACSRAHYCIETKYKNNANGRYCLLEKNNGQCVLPYGAVINRVSVAGKPAQDYCGVNEEFATCDALIAGGDTCTNAADCGTSGNCINESGGRICSNICENENECRLGTTCSPFFGAGLCTAN